MSSNRKTARIAGLLYLIVVLTGGFNLMYIPSKLIVWEDPATTVQNIRNNEMLFRLGVVAGLICYTAFLLLPLALYKLLKPVNKVHAVLMVALALVSVPISLLNLGNRLSVLTLIGDPVFTNAFSGNELQTQIMFYLKSYSNGNRIASVFWGLWLFPFGYLVFRSGFLPKILGIFLMLGCIGYLINFTGEFLFAGGYSKLDVQGYITLPSAIGEIGICLWLLIMGVRGRKIVTEPTLS